MYTYRWRASSSSAFNSRDGWAMAPVLGLCLCCALNSGKMTRHVPEVPSTETKVSMSNVLVGFASEQQRRFDATTAPSARRERGHFGTAPAVADFMAGMFTEIPQSPIRILDPGAGVG